MTCTPCQTCRMTRTVVLVNGLPAAGKSTLAPQLAAELGLPLFTMDVIKEAHADVLGADPPNGLTQREWNRQLGKAAAATIWALLNQSTPGAVLESSWRRDVRHLVEAGLRSVGLSGVAEVCAMPQHMSCDNGSVGDGICPTRFTELSRMTRNGLRSWNTANHLRWDRCFGSTRRRKWTSKRWLPGVAPTHAPPRNELTKSGSSTLQIGRRDERPTR
jgi:hypothetical protein